MATSKATPSYFLAPWEPADASAMRALERGEATPEQQKRALSWIINVGAATYNQSFTPGQPDASAFAEGRRYVGLQIVKLLHINPKAFVKDKAT